MIERFVARNSPWRMLLLLFLALGLVALCAWIAGLFGAQPDPGKAWAGWLGTAIFGLCAMVALPRLFNRDEAIVVDAQGVYWARWSERTIPWLAIKAVERHTVQGQSFLCLSLDDPSRHPSDRMLGMLSGVTRGLGFGDVAVSVQGTDRSIDELIDAIERFSPKGRGGPWLRLEP
jgi:hypothetical protein